MCLAKELEKNRKISKTLCEENQVNELLTRTNTKPPNQAGAIVIRKLQLELETEIETQKLQLNLEAHQEQVMQIQRKSVKKELYWLEIEEMSQSA